MAKKVNLTADASTIVDTMNKAVSQRIKQYHKQKEISFDELSRRAGVSKGALVEMEGCRASPSITLLCHLATTMGVSVADFVGVNSEPTMHLIAEDEIPKLWGGEEGGRARLLTGSGGPDMTELWMWEMQLGEKFASLGHMEGTLGLFYVQSSALTLGVKDHLYWVKTGYSTAARTDVPHFYENQGESPLIFIMTVHEKTS